VKVTVFDAVQPNPVIDTLDAGAETFAPSDAAAWSFSGAASAPTAP